MAALGEAARQRVLCLHGMGTSGSILRRQLHALVRLCPDIDLVFLDGPFATPAFSPLIAKVFGEAEHFRYMERRTECEGDIYVGITEAVAHCRAHLRPGDGVLGFSQGANLATLLAAACAVDEPGLVPRFAVLFCGTEFGWSRQPEAAGWFDAPLAIPSLSVVGDLDALAPTTLTLAELYDESQRRVVHHKSVRAHRCCTSVRADAAAACAFCQDHRPLPPLPADAQALAETIRAFMLQYRGYAT